MNRFLKFLTFYQQLEAMGKMGPLKNVFGMLGASDVPKEVMEQGEAKLKRYKYIIASMTQKERKNERIIHEHGRVQRIAMGSGTSEKEVRQMISEFNKMKKTFGMLKNDRNFKKRFKF